MPTSTAEPDEAAEPGEPDEAGEPNGSRAAAGSVDALGYLWQLRRGQRRAERRRRAYALYCVALLSAVWGVPYLVSVVDAAGDGDWHGATAGRMLDALPLVAPAVLALVPLSAALRARWRGPVLLDAPTVAWVLPHPVDRTPLLLPRYHGALVRAAVLGVVGGGMAGLLVHALGGGGWWQAVLAGAGAGGAAACLGVTAGVAVQRAGAVWPALAGPVPLAVLAAVPLLAAVGRVPRLVGAGAALLVAAGTGAAVVAARRAVPRLPARMLREQATVAVRLTAALYAFDLRQGRATVRRASGRRPRPGRRPPLPRRRALLVPWRDATGLLREPGRLVWAAVWWAVALVCAPLADRHGAPVTLAALLAGYLAAGQLAEPARVEADDGRRAGPLPWPAERLALRHGLLPAALLLVTGAPPVALAGGGAPVLLLAGVPALVGAALVSAYRGIMPAALLLGHETPMGNTGPIQAVLWQVRGPLVILASLAVAHLRAPDAPWPGLGVLWVLGTGASALAWARRRARPRRDPGW
ncbi:DUF6297 family protein [Streptomyces sp. B6B3]|uniref:DUF6297 family protein n=1 Tax=Streptomyces sp. B6B3 TaxID=3153570 RepID=UPI00325DBE9D